MDAITGRELKEMMDNKQVMTIDVDPKGKYKKAHIKGAVNIPYSEKGFVDKVKKKVTSADKNVALCGQKQYSEKIKQVAEKLEKAGYKNVFSYEAGISDWKSSNLEIQKHA